MQASVGVNAIHRDREIETRLLTWGGRLPSSRGHRLAGLAALHSAGRDGHFDVLKFAVGIASDQIEQSPINEKLLPW